MDKAIKVLTCGSVDDGKSTLIGRLLYDTGSVHIDQLEMLNKESREFIDYSLLLDGLSAEREQGITIDVSYKYLNINNTRVIIADCPGHNQYNRNMAVGASFAEIAILLVDSTKDITEQTKRHLFICSMMNIKKIIIAINKIDLIDYNEERYEHIRTRLQELIKKMNIKNKVCFTPVSALNGDNISNKSTNTKWYKGQTILEHIVEIEEKDKSNDMLMMPVQLISRGSFRGIQGNIESGKANVGDKILVSPSNEKAIIEKIYIGEKEIKSASKNQSVTLKIDRELDISRGDVILSKSIGMSNSIKANILWMGNENLEKNKTYEMKIGTNKLNFTFLSQKESFNFEKMEYQNCDTLKKNDVGICVLNLSKKIAMTLFDEDQSLGKFIIIDKLSNETVGAGTIIRIDNSVFWDKIEIDKDVKSDMKNQIPKTIWLTGLPSSGKSTIAKELEKRLVKLNKHTAILDGDNVRHGINKDLDFSIKSRRENSRRIAEIAKIMNENGLITIVASILPTEEMREMVKEILGDYYIEIYISTSIEECIKRDVKGLYKKALDGEISNFTGISQEYEEPKNCNINIDNADINSSVDNIVKYILRKI